MVRKVKLKVTYGRSLILSSSFTIRGHTMLSSHVRHFAVSKGDTELRIKIEECLEGHVISSKRAVLINHPHTHPLYQPQIDQHFGAVPESLFIAPILAPPARNKHVIGLLVLGRPKQDKVERSSDRGAEDAETVKAFCNQVAGALGNSLALYKMERCYRYISGVPLGRSKTSHLSQQIGAALPSILQVSNAALHIHDPPSNRMWTLKPGETEKTWTHLEVSVIPVV